MVKRERETPRRGHLLNLSVDSYHCLVLFALSCASINTFHRRAVLVSLPRREGQIDRDSRSLSVSSSPSLNVSAVSADCPPPPAGPSAAKCWAWSMTSTRRFRNVCKNEHVIVSQNPQAYPEPRRKTSKTGPLSVILIFHSPAHRQGYRKANKKTRVQIIMSSQTR
jgi:hypothetical protein